MNSEIDIMRHSNGCGGEVKNTNAEVPELFCLKCGHKVKDYEVVTFFKIQPKIYTSLNKVSIAPRERNVVKPWWKFW
jgi:hypothetical protein